VINLIETLFGLAILSALVAVVLHFTRRGIARRRWIMAAALLGLAALALEVYVRMAT
jgi:hypothetical protein